MDIIDDLRKIVIASINQLAKKHKKSDLLNFESIVIEIPKGNIKGDFSTNAAMVIAKNFSSSPRDIGEQLKNILMESNMQEYFKKNHLTIIVIVLLVYIILNNFGHGS